MSFIQQAYCQLLHLTNQAMLLEYEYLLQCIVPGQCNWLPKPPALYNERDDKATPEHLLKILAEVSEHLADPSKWEGGQSGMTPFSNRDPNAELKDILAEIDSKAVMFLFGQVYSGNFYVHVGGGVQRARLAASKEDAGMLDCSWIPLVLDEQSSFKDLLFHAKVNGVWVGPFRYKPTALNCPHSAPLSQWSDTLYVTQP